MTNNEVTPTTPGVFAVLGYLAKHPSAACAEIAEATHYSKGHIYHLLEWLKGHRMAECPACCIVTPQAQTILRDGEHWTCGICGGDPAEMYPMGDVAR